MFVLINIIVQMGDIACLRAESGRSCRSFFVHLQPSVAWRGLTPRVALHIQLSTGISLLATSNRRDSLGLVATQEHQMRDERTVGHPMKDDILQMPRDAFPARTGLSDNDAESRENVGVEIRGSAASSTSETYDLPDGLMDVPQVAECLRVSKTSVYKLIERQKIPAIRIGRLLRVRKDELDETLRAMGNDI